MKKKKKKKKKYVSEKHNILLIIIIYFLMLSNVYLKQYRGTTNRITVLSSTIFCSWNDYKKTSYFTLNKCFLCSNN